MCHPSAYGKGFGFLLEERNVPITRLSANAQFDND